MTPSFTSTELLLLAHDEWKRREERKHNHNEQDWCAGFLNGFCTSRTWAREYVNKLLDGKCCLKATCVSSNSPPFLGERKCGNCGAPCKDCKEVH